MADDDDDVQVAKDKEANGENDEKKKGFFQNPVKMYIAYRTRKKMEQERMLLRREEIMKEDLERFLMEIEDRNSWVVFQLRNMNLQRMKRREALDKISRAAKAKEEKELLDSMQEDGLSYFKGIVKGYKRWQNSAAKHLDFAGHEGAILSCKLSNCLEFIFSCSDDKSARLWSLKSVECLRVYSGHTKAINDCDIHPKFEFKTRDPSLLTCSSDGTLRLWNSLDTTALTIIRGHSAAVYRCSFSPDGNSFVSSSEDKSVKMWCFPEGYLLYSFTAHRSPVTAVSFSPTGRFLVSGSDYGERKILMWDAKQPVMSEPRLYPHILYWTPDGLIKRIVIRQYKPKPVFWLAQKQMSWIASNDDLDIWRGEESDDEEMDSESEHGEQNGDDEEDAVDKEEEKRKQQERLNEWRKDDVHELKGVKLSAILVNAQGDQTEASDYNPRGSLIIDVQSTLKPIHNAFIDVVVKATRYDMFSTQSGTRIGEFALDAGIPWRSEQFIESSLMSTNKKIRRVVPPGLTTTANKQGLQYDETLRYYNEDKDAILSTSIEAVWNCPEPDYGIAVITVNFQFRHSDVWHQLTYSLKESPIRMTRGEDEGAPVLDAHGDDGQQFLFDQQDKHRVFFDYVRDKNWEAVAALIEKKAVLYNGDIKHRRRWRVMNVLTEMFDSAPWIILHTPFIFCAGRTKSMAVCDSDYYDPDYNDANDTVYGHGGDEEDEDYDEDEDYSYDEDEDGEYYEGVEGEEEDFDEAEAEDQFDAEGADEKRDGNESVMMEEGGVPESTAPLSRVVQEDNISELSGEIGGESKKTVDSAIEPAVHQHLSEHRAAFISTPTNKRLPHARPKTQYHGINQILFVRDVAGKKFERRAMQLIHAEVDNILQLIQSGCTFHRELRLFPINPVLCDELLAIQGLPSWVGDAISTYRVDMKSKRIEAFLPEVQEKSKALTFSSVKIEEFELIKSGKFGPDIEEFTMPLPQMFPKQAGKAQYALKDALILHEKVVSKLRVEGLPKSLEEVHVPTTAERISKFYHEVMHTKERILRENLCDCVENEVKLHLLQESSCYGGRRATQVQLAGMSPHNPNRLYEFPALDVPGLSYSPTPGDAWQKLPLMVGSSYMEYVGRRPTEDQLQDYFAGITRTFESSATLMTSASQSSIERSVEQLRRRSTIRRGKSKKLKRGMSSRSKSTRSKKLKRKASKGPRKLRKIKTKKASRIVASNKKLPVDRREEVYYGRRIFFPVLPGLHDFLETVATTEIPNEEELLEERKAAEAAKQQAESKAAEAKVPKVKDSVVVSAGLLRRFRINGLELAHHGSVNDAVFAPSEQRIATAGGDGIVKIWDPSDGSLVRNLKGHTNEVMSVRYSATEQFLVSSGADSEILIWSLLSQSVIRRLLGHCDVVYGLAMTKDVSIVISCSHDQLMKSWYTTPRHPDPPDPPKVIAVTDTTALISWTSPPSFNLDVNAFHLQYRVGLRGPWTPSPKALSVPPHYRTKLVIDLMAATPYQFRIRAENRMGKSVWSKPSKQTYTEFGIPEQCERPTICCISSSSMHFYWFAPNPKTFGSASKTYQVRCKGNGKSFEENPMLEVRLEDCVELGAKVLKRMENVLAHHEENKNNPLKSIRTSKLAPDKHLPELINDISLEIMRDIMEQLRRDETMLFIVAEYANLEPGFMYVFETRGVNKAGAGPWSPHTLSAYTQPVKPHKPHPPRILAATLRSILFGWDPPNDGGTAITGYVLVLDMGNGIMKELHLPRSTVSYLWDGLFPGRSYHIRVQATNTVGASELSDWNDVKDSYTLTAAPETPNNPIAVNGTWCEIELEADIPYSNGAPVQAMEVQQRWIEPFQQGEWEWNKAKHHWLIPGEVEELVHVDLDLQQMEIEDKVLKLQNARSAAGFNPYGKDKGKVDQEIEEVLAKLKPNGSHIKFVMRELLPNTLYEFRVRFSNMSGTSEFSTPSHRAKTNVASLPGVCEVPTVISVGVNYVVLELAIPAEGGARIKYFTLEATDLDELSVRTEKITRDNVDDVDGRFRHRMEGLRPAGSYKIRCQAESLVGCGEFSECTGEVQLEMPEVVDPKKLKRK